MLAAAASGAALALTLGAACAQAPAATEKPKDLVLKGDAKCTRCHDEPEVLSIGKTKHGAASNPRTPTCTSCHGESDAHIKGGRDRPKPDRYFAANSKTPADVRSGACLSCHQSDRHLAFWDSGRHRKNDVTCNNCHNVHGTPAAGATIALNKRNPSISPLQTTVRQLEHETCNTCHRQIRSQLLKPSHHPIIEGRVKCSDCHNPHGALSPAMVKSESIPALCTSCHAEKRGPFVFEHPPVEENCLTCHNAHGSNHNRLLAEKAPNVCQDCHDAAQHPGTVYDGSGGFTPVPPRNTLPNTRLIARGCVNCHFHIHGSNAPAMRGRFFLR
jgi:DmsE family decaheme c-type cytochrome